MSLTLLPLFGSSMILGLVFHLLVSINCFLFWLLIDWPWPDASWDTETRQMSIMPPGQASRQHTQNYHVISCTWPLPFAHNTHFLKKPCWLRNMFSILCHLTFIEWFCFEKDEKGPVRGHMSPVTTRVPMNRWDSLHVSQQQHKALESPQLILSC